MQKRARLLSPLLLMLAAPLLLGGCASNNEIVRLETEIKLLRDEVAAMRFEQDRLTRSYGALRKNYVRNIETVGSRLVETSQTAEGATVKANQIDQRVDELAEDFIEIEARFRQE